MSVADQIKDKLDIVEVISASVQLRKTGRALVGFCPFHANTRTPAFTVYPDSQSFHCFGCKASGSVFDFVMRKEGLSFKEALEQLAPRAGVQLREPTPAETQADRQRARLLEICSAAATFYQQQLVSSARAQIARDYLVRRGIDQQSIERFQLGYAPDDWSALLSYLTNQRSFAPDDVIAAGLAVRRENGSLRDMLRGRLIFPIRNARGETIAFGGRALQEQQQPKYLNTAQTLLFDKSSVLYGLDLARDAIRSSDAVVVVEGYIDVITAHQHGFRNLVAPLGTALTDRHAGLLNRLTRQIYLALDADAAGQRAMLKGLQTLSEHLDGELVPVPTPAGMIRWERELNAVIKILVLPEGQDPDEVIKADPERWRALVQAALPVMDFYLQALTADLDLSSAKGKAEAVNRLGPLISRLSNAVEQAHYLQQLAGMLGMSEQILRSALPRDPAQKTGPRARKTAETALVPEPVNQNSREEYMLMLLLRYPSTREAVQKKLEQDLDELKLAAELLPPQIETLFERTVNRVLWQAWLEHGGGDPEAWMAELDEPLVEVARRILALEVVRSQEYRYMNDALNCATILRRQQARMLRPRLSDYYAVQPDDEARQSILDQLVELDSYINTLSAPPRSRLYNDWRDTYSVRGSL